MTLQPDPAAPGLADTAPAPAPAAAPTTEGQLAAMYPSMRPAPTPAVMYPSLEPAQPAPTPATPAVAATSTPPQQAPQSAPSTPGRAAGTGPQGSAPAASSASTGLPGAPAGPSAQASSPTELPAEYQAIAAPEGYQLDPQAWAPIAGELHKLGISKDQAQGLLATYAGMERARQEALDAETAAWHAEAVRTMTAADHEALRVAVRGAPAEALTLLDSLGISSHPALVRWLAGIGYRLSGQPAPAADRVAQLYPSMQGGSGRR